MYIEPYLVPDPHLLMKQFHGDNVSCRVKLFYTICIGACALARPCSWTKYSVYASMDTGGLPLTWGAHEAGDFHASAATRKQLKDNTLSTVHAAATGMLELEIWYAFDGMKAV